MRRVLYLNQSGAAVLGLPLLAAAVTLIVFTVMGGTVAANYATTLKNNKRTAREVIRREIRTLLAAPDLCTNLLEINHGDNTFRFVGALEEGDSASAINGVTIGALTLDNRMDLGSQWEADLVVKLRADGVVDRLIDNTELRTRVRYTLGGGGTVSRCGVVLSQFEACEELGLNWDGANCDICSGLGGAMVVDGNGGVRCVI